MAGWQGEETRLYPDPDDGPFRVTLRYGLDGGYGKLLGLEVTSVGDASGSLFPGQPAPPVLRPDGSPVSQPYARITAGVLRSLPFKGLLDEMREAIMDRWLAHRHELEHGEL